MKKYYQVIPSIFNTHVPGVYTCSVQFTLWRLTSTVTFVNVWTRGQRNKPLKWRLLSESCSTSFNDLFLCSSTVSVWWASAEDSWTRLGNWVAYILSTRKRINYLWFTFFTMVQFCTKNLDMLGMWFRASGSVKSYCMDSHALFLYLNISRKISKNFLSNP